MAASCDRAPLPSPCTDKQNWQSSGSVANPSGVNWAAVDLDAAHGGPTVVAKSRVLVTGGGGMIGELSNCSFCN